MTHPTAHPDKNRPAPPVSAAGEEAAGPATGSRPAPPDLPDADAGTRIAGVERGSAILAVATCILFVICVTAISHSAALAAVAAACITVGVALVLVILRPTC